MGNCVIGGIVSMDKNIRIIPEYPWSQWFTKGIITTDFKQRYRKYIKLYGDKKRYSTTYARYLYAVHTGSLVPFGLEVDHINNDPSDDRLENYQLLTPRDNLKKYYDSITHLIKQNRENTVSNVSSVMQSFTYDHGTKNIKFNCLQCNCIVEEHFDNFNSKIHSKATNNFFCSKKCSSKYLEAINNRPDLPDRITELAINGKYAVEIAKELDIGINIVRKYSKVKLPNGLKEANPRLINKNTIEQINKLALERKCPKQIADILNINVASVHKYANLPLASGYTEANNRKPSEETMVLVETLIKNGASAAAVAKKINIGLDTIRKYATIPIPDYTHASKNTIDQDIIEKINKYSENTISTVIAKDLGITITTVKKYHKGNLPDGRNRIKHNIKKYTSDDIIAKIHELEEKGYSDRRISRELNISRLTIQKFKKNISLTTNDHLQLSEFKYYRKLGYKVEQIQKLLNLSGQKISKYSYYSNNDDVIKEKLLGYRIEAYTEGVISEAVEKNTASDIGTNNNNNYIPFSLDCIKAYSAYDEMQARALKVFYESSGDFTIYSTIETTNSDDIFLTISGTK